LSAILDLKDKCIVSFALGRSNNNQLVFDTFDLAVSKYPNANPLFHSDVEAINTQTSNLRLD